MNNKEQQTVHESCAEYLHKNADNGNYRDFERGFMKGAECLDELRKPREDLAKRIVELMQISSDTAYCMGSCGECGDSYDALSSDLFIDVATEIASLLTPQVNAELLEHLKSIADGTAFDPESERIWEHRLNAIKQAIKNAEKP